MAELKTKSNAVVTHSIASGVITFNVRDAGTFTLDTAALSPVVRERAMLHGLIQRISDRAAIPRDTETGKSATPAQKLDAMKALADFYATGTDDWSPTRAAAPKRSADDMLAELSDEAYAELIAKVEAKRAAARG